MRNTNSADFIQLYSVCKHEKKDAFGVRVIHPCPEETRLFAHYSGKKFRPDHSPESLKTMFDPLVQPEVFNT